MTYTAEVRCNLLEVQRDFKAKVKLVFRGIGFRSSPVGAEKGQDRKPIPRKALHYFPYMFTMLAACSRVASQAETSPISLRKFSFWRRSASTSCATSVRI